MCAIRYHLASHPVYGGGVSLANDLQNEHSIVGNFPDLLMLHHFGSAEQKASLIPLRLEGKFRMTFGLTEPGHGSDATFMETTAKRITMTTRGNETNKPKEDEDDDEDLVYYEINGRKKWQTGAHHCTHMLIFARTSRTPGSASGITAFLVPRDTPGITVESYEWTFNMPTDHATVSLDHVRVSASTILGQLDRGLAVAQTFVHENRIRQAASSCGAARFCLDKSIERAKSRKIWGEGGSLADYQAIQFPVVELMTQVEMLRLLILRTAVEMDRAVEECRRFNESLPKNPSKANAKEKQPWVEIERKLSGQVAMCNFWANRLCCQAADRAIQVSSSSCFLRLLSFIPFIHDFCLSTISFSAGPNSVRSTVGMATRDITPSSTYIAISEGIASLKVQKRFRCERWLPSYLDSGGESRKSRVVLLKYEGISKSINIWMLIVSSISTVSTVIKHSDIHCCLREHLSGNPKIRRGNGRYCRPLNDLS